MGKGDRKTKRGKIQRGTHGVRRLKKIKKRQLPEEKIRIDTKK
ncbi:30S ribosomal protein THX [Sungkyunkwania multivorans]|uniref:30S ribosomal protein THX n=1 Tax=Sungkyunkwania multivorans TaxID=1173618 RepID=A0ABW3CZR1_9FLAO